MAIQTRTYLDGILVKTPVDIAQITLSIVRDDDLHGIGFEASTSTLTFTGDGAKYIEDIKNSFGLKAEIVFELFVNCGDDSDEYEDFVRGKLNMTTYKKKCGAFGCNVKIAVQSISCETILHNRYDQKVNVDNATGFDGITPIGQYADMGFNLTLPAISIQLIDKASNTNQSVEVISDQPGWESNVTSDGFNGYVLPRYENTDFSALGVFNVASFLEMFPCGANNTPDLSHCDIPLTLNTETILGDIKCSLANAEIQYRWKGQADLITDGAGMQLRYKIFRLPAGADQDVPSNWQAILSQAIGVDSGPVDINGTIPITLNQGDWIFIGIFINIPTGFSEIHKFTLTQDPETFLQIKVQSKCQDTESPIYLIHETLSRVTEAITNGCVRVKSEYYGRTDSEPFAFDTDGCGGLRGLTSGLKIRNADNPTFFASLQDLIEGLQAIDNIGMGVEQDPVKLNDFLVLRVEALDYFYQDKELMRCDFIPDGEDDIDATHSYSIIEIGYKKWQINNTNGLDEFNSSREYRTSLTSLSTKLDMTSGLVAGGYPIEITRQQSFANTGAADTTYDNETFIICLKRSGIYGYPYGGLLVEQGNIDSASNILDPTSIYNYRISPIHNLMRWFRSIAAGYPNTTDSDNRLFFGAGTGNLLATGRVHEPDNCTPEVQPVSESQDIYPLQFKLPEQFTPIWKNEIFTYDYPMSLADYKKIKLNPYGYISFQCGTGEWEKGWIKEIQFKLFDGKSTITLKKTWQ